MLNVAHKRLFASSSTLICRFRTVNVFVPKRTAYAHTGLACFEKRPFSNILDHSATDRYQIQYGFVRRLALLDKVVPARPGTLSSPLDACLRLEEELGWKKSLLKGAVVYKER
jgi:hypothetical protein